MKMNRTLQLVLYLLFSIVLIVSPLFEMKVSAFLLIVLLIGNTSGSFSRFQTGILLASVWIISYIYSPYWLVFGGSVAIVAAFSVLLLASGVWAYASASHISWGKIPLPVLPLSILTGLIYVINFRPLSVDIPWRGDEDVHILYVMNLIEHLRRVGQTPNPLQSAFVIAWVCLAVSFVVVLVRKQIRKSPHKVHENIILCVSGGIVVALPAFLLFYGNVARESRIDMLSLGQILRYPYVEKWMSAFFSFVDYAGDIRLYRLVPFLSTILLAWYLFVVIEKKLNNTIVSVLASCAFVTIPLMYFFTSLLYLEMPVVLLMTYCIFNMRDLLFLDSKTFVQKPIWFALLLMSFLKETVFIFLILILAARFILQMRKAVFDVRVIAAEVRLAILAMLPSVIYLFFRKYFSLVPPYGLHTDILLDWSNYVLVGKALVEQMGVLVFVAILGFLTVLKEKEKQIFLVLLFLFTGITVFFMMNQIEFLGYARWNLFVIPIVYYLAYRFFISVKTITVWVFLSLLIAVNVYLSPISTDGVRLPNWGSPSSDTAEYAYPYEEAIRYLQSKHTVSSMVFLGQYYPYYAVRFYETKYQFHPRILEHPFDTVRFTADAERQYLSRYLTDCIKPESETSTVDTIVYHSVNNIDLDMNETYCGTFTIDRRIRNSANSLYILSR
jgi:hypothetical protein